MRGFQPGKARAVPQNYADGGVVSTIKGMLGFGGGKKKPEPLPADLSKMPPTGAGPAASQPEQPKKAISQYSGMSALERRMKEADAYADGGLVRGLADAVRPFSESVGGYWSNSNKEFEATTPNVDDRVVRALNPVTGLGSAVGAMYDAAGNGSARDAAIAAVQAVPMFAAMKVVPAAKSLLPTAPKVAFDAAKTASKVTSSTGAGVVADEAQARGFANGGLVRGPGTGISDDIEDEVEEGTFIMPADSTEAIGPEVMDQVGKAVPVNLSNGEAKLPPEALQAIGAQVMEAIKEVTHTPAAKQARGDDERMSFADGGVVRPEDRPRTIADLARSPGYGSGAGGPVNTPARPQVQPQVQQRPVAAPAPQPQTSQPVPGVQRQGNSYTATTIADRARSPAFGMGASAPAGMPLTRPSAAVVQQAAQPTASAPTIASQVQRSGNSFSAAPATPKPSAPLDPQAQADRAKIGSAWDTVKGWNDDAGRAIADVASLVPRGLVGAYDSAVVRPMRAAGVNADYLSPKLVPDGVDPSSMTPFTDQKRIATEAVSSKAGGVRGFVNPSNVDPSAARPTSTVPTAPQATADAPKPNTPPQAGDTAKTDVREVAPGIFRQGNSFGDSAAAATAGAQPSQGPSARDMQAMNNLIARDPVAGAMDRALGVERDPAQTATGSRRTIASTVAGGGASPASQTSPAGATGAASRGLPQAIQGSTPMEMYARQSEAMKGVADAQRALDQYGPGSGGQGGGTYIKHSGNDWETEKNLKNLRTSASSITNRRGRRGEPSVEQQAYLKALDADMAARSGNNPAAIEAMRQQGETARIGMREAGENARSGRRESIAAELGRGQLDLQRNAQGFTTRQGERQEKLYADYDAAETPEDRATIAQKIRDLSGKNSQDGRYQLVRGEQVYDDKAQALRNTGERLYDTQAGKFVGGGQSSAPIPMPKTQDELKAGQVYETNKGPATWDGKQFTAVAG